MELEFIKMHGCGNDYIYIDCMEKEAAFNIKDIAIKLSDRYFGVGGDGIVLICRSYKADAFMRMFNADGSEGKMCGNAIRCVAKYLNEERKIEKDRLIIETLSGLKTIDLIKSGKDVKGYRVNMGPANFLSSSMPLKTDKKEIVNEKIDVLGREYKITCVSMGNPHCVVFLDSDFVDELDVNSLGEEFEKLNIFKEEFNIEFVEIKSNSEVKMRVYERGSKETLACGTGACAVVSAMVKNSYCEAGQEIAVNLLGGKLKVSYFVDGVYMVGPAEKVFTGRIII